MESKECPECQNSNIKLNGTSELSGVELSGVDSISHRELSQLRLIRPHQNTNKMSELSKVPN